jgi:hypothetical protein
MIAPQYVAFDLSDEYFNLQLGRLADLFPLLFDQLAEALAYWTGKPWDEFTRSVPVRLYEAAFDGTYVIVKLCFLDDEVHLIAHLQNEVLYLVAIHKPPVAPQ